MSNFKKPKVKELARKYNISLLSKKDIEKLIYKLSLSNDVFTKLELSSLKNYYQQRLPVEIAMDFLKINKKCNLTDGEIITIACIKQHKMLLKDYSIERRIKHIIDGLSYPCGIKYNSTTCNCGIKGYVWSFPNIIKRTYWLQDEWKPIIYLKHEPYMTMLEEYDVIQNYIMKNNIRIDVNKTFINHRKIQKRINAYPFYYQKYWEWENDSLTPPSTNNEWRNYFENTGCANHRDLVETVHINSTTKRNKNINYRYNIIVK